ncbi:hypothetical protein QQP08_000136 [Theobroma cacao]|nr:hypothetical protein QQP08_000136 [Theobroma cacao]
MYDTIKRLKIDLGANRTKYELYHIRNMRQIDKAQEQLGYQPSVPAVFIVQQLIGGAPQILKFEDSETLRGEKGNAKAEYKYRKSLGMGKTLPNRENDARISIFVLNARRLDPKIEERRDTTFGEEERWSPELARSNLQEEAMTVTLR